MSIYVSTGDARRNYDVLDTVFALAAHEEGFFKNANPEKAFEGVTKQLIEKCKKLGGDAVLNCQFEYRVAAKSSFFVGFKDKQVIEIFAYGTAVKFTG